VPENVNAIYSMILADWRISAKKDSRDIWGTCRFHHPCVLDMRKLCAKWVPKCLNANQKRDRVVASQAILEHFRWNRAGFVARLVTMDETWIYLYDPETEEQSKE
jgi:histone-lysine N-methyltransferase SETMAR